MFRPLATCLHWVRSVLTGDIRPSHHTRLGLGLVLFGCLLVCAGRMTITTASPYGQIQVVHFSQPNELRWERSITFDNGQYGLWFVWESSQDSAPKGWILKYPFPRDCDLDIAVTSSQDHSRHVTTSVPSGLVRSISAGAPIRLGQLVREWEIDQPGVYIVRIVVPKHVRRAVDNDFGGTIHFVRAEILPNAEEVYNKEAPWICARLLLLVSGGVISTCGAVILVKASRARRTDGE